MKATYRLFATFLAGIAYAGPAMSQVFETVSASKLSNAYMDVYELPSNGGAYVFGSGWGIADLNATFTTPSSVTFTPNSIGDPSPFWYTPSGGPGAAGNKTMQASLYGSSGALYGQTLTFTVNVSSFTLVSGYTFKAFIYEIDGSSSPVSASEQPISSTGVFSVSKNLVNNPSWTVVWGLQMTGPSVWSTDLSSKGSVTLTAVPEPATYAALSALGLFGFGLWRRARG